MKQLDHGTLGIEQASNIPEVDVCFLLLHEVRKKCLRCLLVPNLEPSQALVFVDHFSLIIFWVRF